MAAKTEPEGKGGGLMGLLIPVLGVVLIGLGTGFGIGTTMGPGAAPTEKPDAAEASHAKTDDPHSKKPADDAHGAKKPGAHGETPAEGEEVEAEPPIDPTEIAIVPLPPVVTNIAEPQSVWVRMEGTITYLQTGEQKAEVLAPVVAHHIVNYLRTLKLSDLQGTDGVHFVSEDINNIVQTVSEGQVRKVLITGLIVE